MSSNSDSAWQKVPVRKPKRIIPSANSNSTPSESTVTNQAASQYSNSAAHNEHLRDSLEDLVQANSASDTSLPRPIRNARDTRPRKPITLTKTFASLVSKIDARGLLERVKKNKKSTPGMFRLWCDEIYTSLNEQLLAVQDKTPFLPIAQPWTDLPDDLREAVKVSLDGTSSEFRVSFALNCLNYLSDAQEHRKSSWGARVYLQYIYAQWPELVLHQLKEFSQDIHQHKNASTRHLYLWAYSQAGLWNSQAAIKLLLRLVLSFIPDAACTNYVFDYGDYVIGEYALSETRYRASPTELLYTFDMLFPVASARHQVASCRVTRARWVTVFEEVERKLELKLPPVVPSASATLSGALQERAVALYEKLKDLLFDEPHPDLRSCLIFSFLFRFAIYDGVPDNNAILQELASNIEFYFSKDPNAASTWKMLGKEKSLGELKPLLNRVRAIRIETTTKSEQELTPSGRLASSKAARRSLLRRCFSLLALLTLLALATTTALLLVVFYIDGTDTDKWIKRGTLAQRVAINPIAEHVRRAVGELTSDLHAARGALEQAATFEWWTGVRETLARVNWSLFWRVPRAIALRVLEELLAYDWRGLYEQLLTYTFYVVSHIRELSTTFITWASDHVSHYLRMWIPLLQNPPGLSSFFFA